MVDLVRAVRAKAKKKDRREFLLDRRLVEKYPDDFEVVDADPPAPQNEAGVELAD